MNKLPIPVKEIKCRGLQTAASGSFLREEVFPGEITGLTVETLGLKGPVKKDFPADDSTYFLLLPLEGNGIVHTAGRNTGVTGNSMVRIPYNRAYAIEVTAGRELLCLRFSKRLDEKDKNDIKSNSVLHEKFYAPKFSDCPAYHEDIKSAKTISRMLLPENYIPRFCMGSVETTGPDLVAAHEHPMLEQLFFGLKNCDAVCHADGNKGLLRENTLLHVPLGSNHYVTVDKDKTLSYIWLDFFTSLADQTYMSTQHHIVDPEKK